MSFVQFINAIFLIIQKIGPENGALMITILAFAIVGFSLYVVLMAIKVLALRKNNE